MVLGVVAGVGQQDVERVPSMGLADDGLKLDIIALRAAVHHGPQDQVGRDIDHDRQFRPTMPEMTLSTPLTPDVVGRAVPGFQAGGIDGAGGSPLADQAPSSGQPNRHIKQTLGAPFFRRRPWA